MLSRDDVIRMAREAEAEQLTCAWLMPELERFAAAAYAAGAAAEREACAQVCDAKHAIRSKDGFPREASTARALAKEIRQRTTDHRAPGCVQPGAGAGCQAPCRCGPDGCADSACPGRVE